MEIKHCLRCGHDWCFRGIGLPVRCGWCKSPYWNQPKKKESHASLEDRGSQKGSVAVRRSGDKVGTAVGRGESVVRVEPERTVEESVSGPDAELGGDEEAIDDPESIVHDPEICQEPNCKECRRLRQEAAQKR